MARALFTTLEPFRCQSCSTRLGWTSAGEAKRINLRAHVFCDQCKDKAPALTERQQELLDTLAFMKARGETPSVGGAADLMGISRGRAHQLVTAVRARGYADHLESVVRGETVDTSIADPERVASHADRKMPAFLAPVGVEEA